MELTYTPDENGILYPDLEAPKGSARDIGTWGRRRKKFLQEHRPWQYAVMKTEGTLIDHLVETNECAEAMFAYSVPRRLKALGACESQKKSHQMLWVQMMNSARQSVIETINCELIYV